MPKSVLERNMQRIHAYNSGNGAQYLQVDKINKHIRNQKKIVNQILEKFVLPNKKDFHEAVIII